MDGVGQILGALSFLYLPVGQASPVVKVSLAGLLAMSTLRETRDTSYSASGLRFPMEYWFSSCVRSMVVRSPGTSLMPYESSMLSMSARGLSQVMSAEVSVTSLTSTWLGASRPVDSRGQHFRGQGQQQGLTAVRLGSRPL